MTSHFIRVCERYVALATLCMAVSASASVPFYASFDGTVDADVGAMPQAEVHDGPAQFEVGKRGQALLVGDDSAYLSFDAANLPAAEGTIEFWIKPLGWDSVSTLTFHVWVETDTDGQAGQKFIFYKYYKDQSLRLIREQNNPLVERKPFAWKGWIHLAVTWSPQASTIYWNGEPSESMTPLASAGEEFLGRMLIGDRAWAKDIARNGERTLLDEFYIYDRALEPEEIRWAYEHAADRKPGTDVPGGLVPMKVKAKILPSQGKIVAQAQHRLDEDACEKVTGTAELLGPTSLTPVALRVAEHDAEGVFPFDKLAAGDYTLRVRLMDADGEVLDEAEDSFFVPANEWLGNTIGISDRVPPPFTVIDATDEQFNCWGRQYEFDDSGLPQQITSVGHGLLAAPVQVNASLRGSRLRWRYQEGRHLEQADETRAIYAGQWSGHTPAVASIETTRHVRGDVVEVEMNWRAEAEYDGMFKYTLTLTPTANDVDLDHLELRFPLKKEFAALINSPIMKGAIPEGVGNVIQAPVANWWWVGNEDAGLSAFYESDQAWDRIDRPDGFYIDRRGDTVEVVWSFIKSKFKLDKPWTFTFGMTATPVKSTAGLSGRPSRVVYSNPWLMDTPLSYTEAGLPVTIANEGVRDKIWSDMHVLWIGGPWTQYALDWRARPDLLNIMPTAIAKLKAKRMWSMQFFLPEVSERVPEWRYWRDEWNGNNKTTRTDKTWDRTTCTSSWIDYFVWYMTNTKDRYGFSGYYVEAATPVPVVNADVGVGYMRDGMMRPIMPWFGMREVFKRLYIATKQRGDVRDEPSMILAHASDVLPVSYLGFIDSRLNGHQHQHQLKHQGKSPVEVIPLDQWRSGFLAANLGHRCDLFAYREQCNRTTIALLLLHDAGAWYQVPSNDKNMDMSAPHDMWTLQDEFGVQDSEFLPYWKNQSIVGGQTDQLKVSVYRKPTGGALMIVANLSNQPQQATLNVDWRALQSSGTLTLTDAQGDQIYKAVDRSLTVDVPAQDYRAILIE